jgi:hypothetical protein
MNEQIKQFTKQVGIEGVAGPIKALERFAELIAAYEREECAKLFDARDSGSGGYYEPHEPAEIIRARSKA